MEINYKKLLSPKEILYEITFPQFPTHIATTNNKTKPNKYSKINGQLIYNDKITKFSRDTIVKNMKKYLINNYNWDKVVIREEDYPLGIALIFKIPINYGSVGRRLDKKTGRYYISWNPPLKNYKPNWDVDNLGNIWSKVFNDVIQPTRISPRSGKTIEGLGIIPDDSVNYIQQPGPPRWIPCDTLDERELIFVIYKI